MTKNGGDHLSLPKVISVIQCKYAEERPFVYSDLDMTLKVLLFDYLNPSATTDEPTLPFSNLLLSSRIPFKQPAGVGIYIPGNRDEC